jgi:hypothetical protein
MDEKINSTILFLQEGDNNSSPIDFIMTDENKKIIEGAGDNQLNSSKSSIQYVGKDSVTLKGLGQYTKRDTIIENQSYSYFIYNPGTEDALYSVQFSFVGDGKGDYIRQSYGIFKWVGIGKGSYSAINLLPLPERKRYAVWNLSFNPNKDLKISNELAVSNYDRNTLSDLDGQGINGFGINTKIDYSVELKNIFDREMGSLKISASNYYLSDKFSSPTRTNEVDYFYTWNIRDSSESNKHIYSMMLDYAPTKKMDLKYEYAKNNYGISNHAARNYFEYFVNDSTYPALNVKLTNVKNQELSFNNDFNSIYANTNYNLDKYEVSVGFLNEDKKIIGSTSDSLIDGYRIMSLNSNLGFKFTKRSTLQYEIEYREDYIPSFLVLEKESYRLINKLNLNYLNNENLSALISGGFQKLEFTEKYMKNSTGNNLNIFAKSLLHYSNEKKSIESNYYYESSSQYSAKNQKIYLRVEKGKGTHIYLGDLNKNGVADENEFQQVKYDGDYIPLSVKTDELAPVTDLKTSFRIKITPVREIQRAETMIEKLLSNVSTETNYQINEMNKTDKNEDIYLLKLSKFLNDSNTIQGNQSFTQDLFLLEKINDQFCNYFKFVVSFCQSIQIHRIIVF